MPPKLEDPDNVRDAVTIRIKRGKLNKINRYRNNTKTPRSELLAGFIDDRVAELKI